MLVLKISRYSKTLVNNLFSNYLNYTIIYYHNIINITLYLVTLLIIINS